MTPLLVLILAAGKGTRMQSRYPKVLQPLGGRPMIFHLLDTVLALPQASAALVHGYGSEDLQHTVNRHYDGLRWVEQKEQLGTGHAVRQAIDLIAQSRTTLIVYGDTPLIQPDTLETLYEQAQRCGFALLTAITEQPQGYGRILRDENDALTGIVEEKDADIQQRLITEINTGVMALDSQRLLDYLPRLDNHNAQQEYYITDLVAMMAADGLAMETVLTEDFTETLGINNKSQLAEAESVLRYRQAQQLLEQGVTLIDPLRLDIQGQVSAGQDILIEPNVMLIGNVQIGNRVHIEAGCRIENSIIGDDVHIHAYSVLENAHIGDAAQIGPFARLRPQTRLAAGAKIGNFVETKAATIGAGSKINHLSYVGDATLGANVNIGAGTITCNYDGANKHQTIIEDQAFIGSNSALVAPVQIKKGATVGAGSVISKTVEENQLAVARGRQINLDGWQRPEKKKTKT